MGLNLLRVLVTRPEPGASETARRLEVLGFAPVVLPLSQTRALPVDVAVIPENVDAVAVTSANALRHAPQNVLAMLAKTRCHAVGGKTASAARQAGFSQVIEGPGDAAGLAALLAEDRTGAKTIVYLCGRVRLAGFEARLTEAGVAVVAIETYDTVEADAASGLNLTSQPSGSFDIALLHSTLGAQALLKIVRRPEAIDLFVDTIFLCLSVRIASVLAEAGCTKIRVAAEPTEQALLFLLAEQS